MSLKRWPASVETMHTEEMEHIRRLADDIKDHELEADLHPFLQTVLDWASLRTSIRGSSGYRIKSIAQYMMTIPPDAYDPAEPTDRKTRAMARDAPVAHEELEFPPNLSSMTIQSAADTSASAITAEQKRENDRRRTPDYATLLTPNLAAKAKPRLLFVHELKRWASDEPTTRKTRQAKGQDALTLQFMRMETQTSEQAELALWTFNDLKEVHVMCHIGPYFRVIRYARPSPGPARKKDKNVVVVPLYKSKVSTILNKEWTDYSDDFKRWWTNVKKELIADLTPPSTAPATRSRGLAVFGDDAAAAESNSTNDVDAV
ncbi:hypothetical protein EVJ58_g5941 [Rhodofomes roseus]|uniref:Uncharacterized protein n=1 Tax=Rhodofomes roseus TaxID=34475 RepID=A0A4Y9YA36_9APHY|nr:hypothetical protein EVJ58_g5941 [Rhodofomes roseus]